MSKRVHDSVLSQSSHEALTRAYNRYITTSQIRELGLVALEAASRHLREEGKRLTEQLTSEFTGKKVKLTGRADEKTILEFATEDGPDWYVHRSNDYVDGQIGDVLASRVGTSHYSDKEVPRIWVKMETGKWQGCKLGFCFDDIESIEIIEPTESE